MTHQLSRLLDREVYNFGFNGVGQMELNMMQYLVQIPETALFVIDCSWNMDAAMIRERTGPLVRYVRAHPNHTQTPILLVSGTPYRKSWLASAAGASPAIVDAASGAAAKALAAEYRALVGGGVVGLSYLAGSSLFDTVGGRGGGRLDDPTYNSVHPDDLGHTLMAQKYLTVLPPILAGRTVGAADAEAELLAPSPPSPPPLPPPRKLPLEFDWTSMEDVDVVGRAFAAADSPTPFSRLPSSAAPPNTRAQVWNASLCSSGVALRFATNASKIALRYTTIWTFKPEGGPGYSWIAAGDEQHWAMSGLSGVDLYALDTQAKAWRFASSCSWISEQLLGGGQVGCAMSDLTDPEVAHVIADGLPDGKKTNYMLHLPLYNGIVKGQIGAWSADGSARIERLPSALVRPAGEKAVVWYGTSILQGAMAARPGHQFTNIIARELDVELYNLGFSASGTMELAVAEHMVAIERPASVYIIDCIWNMNPQEVEQRTEPLVRFLRANGTAGAEIVLVEGSPAGQGWASQAFWPGRNPGNIALAAAYARLVAAGTPRLHYVESAALYARAALWGSAADVTMAGVHPGDVGTQATAEFWLGFLPALLKKP
eukprot:SAG11_NODE_827_length_6974_cov_4.300945_2_plen_600_part_00